MMVNNTLISLKVDLYKTRTRFAALVKVKQTKVVLRVRFRTLYKRLSLFYFDHSFANAAKPRSRSV